MSMTGFATCWASSDEDRTRLDRLPDMRNGSSSNIGCPASWPATYYEGSHMAATGSLRTTVQGPHGLACGSWPLHRRSAAHCRCHSPTMRTSVAQAFQYQEETNRAERPWWGIPLYPHQCSVEVPDLRQLYLSMLHSLRSNNPLRF